AVQEGRYLGVSFHPELTEDYRVTQYFIEHIVAATTIEKV
ncbi:pyridoxal 5'-phosphate synthase glutaminase subunit PdxT, partial [Mesorhizobium sp. M8A.F.Ca.ET.173.01.1.1]